jgi:hypothetical protein
VIQLASMSFRLIEAERAQHPVSLLWAVLGVTGARAAVARAISRGPNWPSVGSARQNHDSASRGLPSTEPHRTGFGLRAGGSARPAPAAWVLPSAARRLCDDHREPEEA